MLVNNSTNIIKTTNHLSQQIIEHWKMPWHMTSEIQVLGWDRWITVATLNIKKLKSDMNWLRDNYSQTCGAGTAYPSEHLSSPRVFSGVHGARSLVLCLCFVDRCLSFCTFSLGHCVLCSSSIYEFWLPLWYLHTLLKGYLYITQHCLYSLIISIDEKCI